MEITALGKRKLVVNGEYLLRQYRFLAESGYYVEMPAHFNLNLSAEYRYSKILSFWAKFNNISYNRYYEWAYYPSQRFMLHGGIYL